MPPAQSDNQPEQSPCTEPKGILCDITRTYKTFPSRAGGESHLCSLSKEDGGCAQNCPPPKAPKAGRVGGHLHRGTQAGLPDKDMQ